MNMEVTVCFLPVARAYSDELYSDECTPTN